MALRLGSDKLSVGASSSPLMPSDYEVLYKSGRTINSSPNITPSTSSSSIGSFLNKVGSIVPGVGDVLGFASNLINNRSNRKLAEMQNRWNLEQWYRENEYNLPKNQLQRYKDAGINPMLAVAGIEPGNAPELTSAPMANQQPYTDFSGIKQIPSVAIAEEANNISRYNAETNRLDVESNIPIKKQQLLNMQQEEKNLKATQNQIVATTNHIHWLISNARKEGIKLQKEIDYQQLINSFEEQFGAKTRQAQLDNLLADTRHKNALIREINNNMYIAKKNLEIAIKSTNFTITNGKKLTEIQRVICNNNAKLMKSEIDNNVKRGKLTFQEAKQKKLEVDNYWNQRGQDFLQQTFNLLMMAILIKGKNPFGQIGKGSYEISTMDGKPPVPYN